MTTYITPSEAERDPAESFKPVNFEGWAALAFHPFKKSFVNTTEGRRLEVITALDAFETVEEIEEGDPTEHYNFLIAWGRVASILNRALVADQSLLGQVTRGRAPRPGQRPEWLIVDLDEPTKLSLIAALQKMEDQANEASVR